MLFNRQWLILYSISEVIGQVWGRIGGLFFLKVIFALLTSNFVSCGFRGLHGESIGLTALSLGQTHTKTKA